MKHRTLFWSTWIFTSYFFCGAIAAGLNCSDYKGNIVQNGKTFQPDKDMCKTCQCDDGFPTMCKSLKCAPPTTCVNWKPLLDQCCKFECLETDVKNTGDSQSNSTKPSDNGVDEASSDNITTLGLRMVASTVTSFLVLALLLFMVHRLRQRRLMMAMRRYQNNQREQLDEFEETVIPEYWLQCPPYEDPPPPYSPPKPDRHPPPREAPPPYEEIQNNNNNTITQDPPQQNNLQHDSPIDQICHDRQSNNRIQRALNTELLQNIRLRQQPISRSSSEESVDISLPNQRAHYIRRSNSTTTTNRLNNNNNSNTRGSSSDRYSVTEDGMSRIVNNNNFAVPLSCSCDTVPNHRAGYNLPKSNSNVNVIKSRNNGQDLRSVGKSSSGSGNPCHSLHRGTLPREQNGGLEEMSSQGQDCHSSVNMSDNVNNNPEPQSSGVSIDTLEGYVPPYFQDLPDGSPIRNLPRHQRYRSLPSYVRTDSHMSGDNNAGHLRSNSHDSSGARISNAVSSMNASGSLPDSSEINQNTMNSDLYNREPYDYLNEDRRYNVNQLVTFRSPRRSRFQERFHHSGPSFNSTDIAMISESGLSAGDTQQDLCNQLEIQELRLPNSIQSSECDPENMGSLPCPPGQSLSVHSVPMPRSSSIVSDVSMLSVCSETGEKKLSQIAGQALGNDAQYPENMFGGGLALSISSRGDNLVTTNDLDGACSSAATNMNVSGHNSVADANNQNGNPSASVISANSSDACVVPCYKNERDSANRQKQDKSKLCKESRLPHVKLQQKNKHKTHRPSSGSHLLSANKKRHSSACNGSVESSGNLRSLPRSKSEVKHGDLSKQYRMKKGDSHLTQGDTAVPGVHGYHSVYREPDHVTYSVGANNWGEVSGLYAVSSIMNGDSQHSKSKSKTNNIHKVASGNNRQPKMTTEGNLNLFCPTNVAFVKKKTRSNRRSRQGNIYPANPIASDIKINGYSSSDNKDLDIELSPMHELSDSNLKFYDHLRTDNQEEILSCHVSNLDDNYNN